MRNTEFFFASPALLLAVIPAVLLVMAAYRYLRKGAGEPAVERPAMALRIAEVIMLVLILAGPQLVSHHSDVSTVVLLDRSTSMAGMEETADGIALALAGAAGEDDAVLTMEFAGTAAQSAPRTDSCATDIEAALDAAASAMPERAIRRIVLVTDGAATDGDLSLAAEKMAERGMRVDAVYVDTTPTMPETELTQFELPVDAAEGQRFLSTMIVQANVKTSGMLTVYADDAPVHEESIEVHPGVNTYTVYLTAAQLGDHLYRAELKCEADTLEENNMLYGCMHVTSGARVLLVDGTGAETEKLAQLLMEEGHGVDTVLSGDLPQNMAKLCEYGLIVLMNVDAGDLPEGSGDLLETYVSQYGRSVLTTGGENTYIYGRMKDTAFERFLPVNMSVKEKESAEPVALMLVMDVTDSMTRASMGVPIEMARRGAIKCVEALNSNDYAGVITFADDAQVLVDLTPMEQKDAVIDAINGIETADPDRVTKFSGALNLADETLKAFDRIEKKHVIFITDGSPADVPKELEGIVKRMRADGITMSTIAVGRIMNVVKLLEQLSVLGGGRCYFVEGASDLPDIMSTDTVLSQVEYTVDDPFIAQIGTRVFAIEDENAVTQLYGYIRTAAKGSASVALSTPEGRPVYAKWDYGAGRAASFMSDLSGNWSRNWFIDEKGRRLIAGMIGALVPDTLTRSGQDIAVSTGGMRARISAADLHAQAADVQAHVLTPGGSACAVSMTSAEDGFTGEIPLNGIGRYALTLTWQDAQGNTLEAQEMAFAHARSSEYAVLSRADGHAALMELCSRTGGVAVRDVQELLGVDLGSVPQEHDAAWVISILVLGCLMADIVIRKTKLKRIRAYFAERKAAG